MPPPRRLSPHHKDRRSRSYSPRYRTSRSPREQQRSRSPQINLRSPEPKHYSCKRGLSRSPRIHSRSPYITRSRSPANKSSPGRKRHPLDVTLSHVRSYPLKRLADSSVTWPGYWPKSPNQMPVERSQEKLINEHSPVSVGTRHYVGMRSPSPRHHMSLSPYSTMRHTVHSRHLISPLPFNTMMYTMQPSTSKQHVFPFGQRNDEIDFVTIVDRGPKMEKLGKRFQTMEQVAHGPFELDENISISIHRGPSHIKLDDDVDVPVNYAFSSKIFVMIFPQKDYVKALFDRDELKAFHHDDILDEEAYVEKRTITMKQTDKQKHRTYKDNDDNMDYKVTVGVGRDGYNDRRMVQDSRTRSYHARSSSYDAEIPVTIRFDLKPDARYEKLYCEQQRLKDQSLLPETCLKHEDKVLLPEMVHRKPNDLRYNLMRKKHKGDNNFRKKDSGIRDARERIEARRRKDRLIGDRQGRSPRDRFGHQGPSFESLEEIKPIAMTELPEFKNRLDDDMPPAHPWGYCQICQVTLSSEDQAYEHVNSVQHCSTEGDLELSKRTFSEAPLDPPTEHSLWSTDISVPHTQLQGSSQDNLQPSKSGRNRSEWDVNENPRQKDICRLIDKKRTRPSKHVVWFIGTGEMKACLDSLEVKRVFPELERKYGISVIAHCDKGLHLSNVVKVVTTMKSTVPSPEFIWLHVGSNDINKISEANFRGIAVDMIDNILTKLPNTRIIWGQLLPRWVDGQDIGTADKNRVSLDDTVACYTLEKGGCYVRYPIELKDQDLFIPVVDDLNLSSKGLDKIEMIVKFGLVSFVHRKITIHPDFLFLPPCVHIFVQKNILGIGKRNFPRRKKFTTSLNKKRKL